MAKGFHNSFDAYCEWCEAQSAQGLKTMNWGKWWDEIGQPDQADAIAQEIDEMQAAGALHWVGF